MSSFTIRQRTYPLRCEVCHQTDQFQPLANYCTRCSELALAHQEQQDLTTINSKALPLTASDRLLFGGSLISIFALNFILLMVISTQSPAPLMISILFQMSINRRIRNPFIRQGLSWGFILFVVAAALYFFVGLFTYKPFRDF